MELNAEECEFFCYVGYAVWQLQSHSSVPALSQSPQTVDPNRNLPDPNLGEPSSKRNNFIFQKPGEIELGSSDLRPNRLRFHSSPFIILLWSHPSVPIVKNQAQ